MSTFIIVSEDYYNRSQSWCFTGLYRNHSGEYRVSIRANAYEDQSHATIEQWGQGGWNVYASLPTHEWYADCPSYGKRALDDGDRETFLAIRDRLHARFAAARWGNTEPVQVVTA